MPKQLNNSMSQNQSKSFKALKKKWYAKLEKSGFEDIEQNEDYLKQYTSTKFYRGRQNGKDFEELMFLNESKETYYRLAGHFLNDYEFADAKEKRIWALHSEGESFVDIAEAIRNRHNKANKDSVNRVIKRLAEEMLKKYKTEADNDT